MRSIALDIQIAFLKAIEEKESWKQGEIKELYIYIVNNILLERLVQIEGAWK